MTDLHLIEVRGRPATATKPNRLRLYSHSGHGVAVIVDRGWDSVLEHLEGCGFTIAGVCDMAHSVGGVLVHEFQPLGMPDADDPHGRVT